MSEEQNALAEPLFAVTRISIGWVFFWAFIDKTFGLGYYWYQEELYGTAPERAWINGGEPVAGFLKFGTQGKYLHETFAAMAESGLVEFLYMFGLLGIGISMMTGAGRKLGGGGGALLMILMWLASLPLDNNPIIDDHLIYAFVLLILGFTPHFGRKYSLADWWAEKAPHPILE